MKVIIAGGRELNPETVFVGYVVHLSGWYDQITEEVCGKARGVDTAGENWANLHGIPVKPFPVTNGDYALYGRYRGPKERNQRMADYADALILIWDGKSGGSANMMARAIAKGLPVYEYNVVTKVGRHHDARVTA